LFIIFLRLFFLVEAAEHQVELDIGCELNDAVLLVAGADEQGVAITSYNIAVETLNDNGFVFRDMDDGVVYFVWEDSARDDAVAIVVVGVGVVEQVPGFHIGPRKGGFEDIDVLSMLHDAEVDRDGVAEGVDALDLLCRGMSGEVEDAFGNIRQEGIVGFA
jgi:hypothetical protein